MTINRSSRKTLSNHDDIQTAPNSNIIPARENPSQKGNRRHHVVEGEYQEGVYVNLKYEVHGMPAPKDVAWIHGDVTKQL